MSHHHESQRDPMHHDEHHEHGHDHDHDHDHDHGHDAGPLTPIRENGKTYWRSLDHVAQTPEMQSFITREFPEGASEFVDPVSRRSFMTLMGASVALAGLGTGCVRRPVEKIVPHSKRPEDTLPGLPQYYATTFQLSGRVTGLVVKSNDGRPTKIEGNKLHPASMGASGSLEQGAILSLYDPDRTVRVSHGGAESTWAAYDAAWNEGFAALRANGGRGLLVIHEATRSPSFAATVAKVRETFPEARVVEWDPVSGDETIVATRLAYGRALEPVFSLAKADTIVDVDADILGAGPFRLRHGHDWATRRAPDAPGGMNRLWAVEANFTVTGGTADHRLRIRSGDAGAFLRALAAELQKRGVEIPAGIAAAPSDAFAPKFVQTLAKELAGKRGRSVVAVGRHQPAAVQAIGFAINEALGNVGETVRFSPAHAEVTSPVEGIKAAAKALASGQVDTLVILGGNPAFDAPADLAFADAMAKAKTKIHLTTAPNETSRLADWVLPETHFLEEWSDAVASDGTYSVVQPLVQPIWDGRSKIEVLTQVAGAPRKGYDVVREHFLGAEPGRTDLDWRKALHDGVHGGPSFVDTAFDAGAVASAAGRVAKLPAASASALDLVFLVDNKVFDGRFSNNGWLQELPDSMTKLTWTNAALVSPATAKELGVETNQMVRIEQGGRTLDAGVWVQPGLADHTVAIALGYGRKVAGRVGENRGFDAYQLRTSDALWMTTGAKLTRIAGTALLATTQNHQSMEGRPLVREQTAQEYAANPTYAQEMVKSPPLVALWKDHEYTGQQWGMTIDLNACIGCNGCMIACQAENNIPVVGPEQVRMGRQMHWIRIDRYFASTSSDESDLSEPEVVHQPVSCVQCENAPCENVCPVAATVHSKEGGLNDMIYNRCIGTRYCSNNCPYKVRRFNFFDWHSVGEGTLTDVQKLAFNPDVTVRTRGVMEKCTYCIQRINAAKRDAKVRGSDVVADGAITPACAQACPTEAIVFGDINDPNSRVSKIKAQPRNYELLGELNTKPRTSYLARIRNPNPEMVS